MQEETKPKAMKSQNNNKKPQQTENVLTPSQLYEIIFNYEGQSP